MVVVIREVFKELFGHDERVYEYGIKLGYHEEDGYQGNLDFTRIKEIATTIIRSLCINNLYVTIIHEPRSMRWRLLFEFVGVKHIHVVNLVSYQELYNAYALGQFEQITYHYTCRVKSFFNAQFRFYPQVWRLHPGRNILEVELPHKTMRVDVKDIKVVATIDLGMANFEIIIENQNRINKRINTLFIEDIPLQCNILRAFNFNHSWGDEAWLIMPRARNIVAHPNNSFTIYMNIENEVSEPSTEEITRLVREEINYQINHAFGIPEEMLFGCGENRSSRDTERISPILTYGQPIIIGIDSANRIEGISNANSDAEYIGDISCANNARSKYLRCAINPTGLCQDCKDYEEAREAE